VFAQLSSSCFSRLLDSGHIDSEKCKADGHSRVQPLGRQAKRARSPSTFQRSNSVPDIQLQYAYDGVGVRTG
jgi:hypothetical protein